jgi:hypothetical protein
MHEVNIDAVAPNSGSVAVRAINNEFAVHPFTHQIFRKILHTKRFNRTHFVSQLKKDGSRLNPKNVSSACLPKKRTFVQQSVNGIDQRFARSIFRHEALYTGPSRLRCELLPAVHCKK